MKKSVRGRYRKKINKRGEPNCIICSPNLRGYRHKYRPNERRRVKPQPYLEDS